MGRDGIAVSASWQTWDDDNLSEDSGYDAVEDISAAASMRLPAVWKFTEKALETGEPTQSTLPDLRLAPVTTEPSADSIEEPAQESGD